MNFKIPEPILYYAIGLNSSLFLLGLALGEWRIAALGILSGALCAFPLFLKNEE